MQGNSIGVDATGLTALDGSAGVEVDDSTGNLIGGVGPGTGNLIANPGADAVRIYAAVSTTYLGTVVEGNTIGTDSSGNRDFVDAIGVHVSAAYNFVGGADPAAGNRISNSSLWGVAIDDISATGRPSRDVFLSNLITRSYIGAVRYVPLQPETPQMTRVAPTATPGMTLAAGTLHGRPGYTFTIQFFLDDAPDISTGAETQTYLASTSATTGPDGLTAFSTTLPTALLGGTRIVTVTATGGLGGNTSQTAYGLALGAALYPTVAITQAVPPAGPGAPATLTASVAAPAGVVPSPGGRVVFLDNGVFLGSGLLNAAGTVSFTTAALTAGTHKFTASYRGDATYNGTDTAPLVVALSPVPPTPTVSIAEAVKPTASNPFATLTATVVAGVGVVPQPGGRVVFLDNGVVLGSGLLDASGTVSLVTARLVRGTHKFTASYRGDAVYAGTDTAPLVVTL